MIDPSKVPPDILKLIGSLVLIFGGVIATGIWRVATWKARVDYDLANLGEMLGTSKGKDLAPKLRKKRGVG